MLVRYLVQDDPEQARKASSVITRDCTRESPGFINRIVLCELVWVLEDAYGYSKEAIAAVLQKVLQTSQFRIEEIPVAWTALRQYQKGKADFADCLLEAVNRQAGCDRTVTFDRQAGKLEGFELL
ncbi:MAG: PIN domain-containing protein [Nitrospirales bacterium]